MTQGKQVGEVENFPTLVEIKNNLPKECFVAELHTSIYYVLRSIFLVFSLGSFAYLFLLEGGKHYIENTILRQSLWALYWHLQGIVFWGIFVLGHDCGHGSFSKYPLVNHLFGNLLHSFILVPYESWKTTHRKHHKNTGNIDKDEIFYPHREDTTLNLAKRLVVVTFSFAWMLYLYGKKHFWPKNSLYENNVLPVVISIAWWAAAFALFCYSISAFGFSLVFSLYIVPLLFFMGWLVLVTFLHHNDPEAIWYGNSQWTYVKGNLSSIDRSYGFIVDNLIHDIGTHQIHHLFPKIPHYKLKTATVAFRKQYPKLVRQSDDSILLSFFKNWLNYTKYGNAPPGVEKFTYKDTIATLNANSQKAK